MSKSDRVREYYEPFEMVEFAAEVVNWMAETRGAARARTVRKCIVADTTEM